MAYAFHDLMHMLGTKNFSKGVAGLGPAHSSIYWECWEYSLGIFRGNHLKGCTCHPLACSGYLMEVPDAREHKRYLRPQQNLETLSSFVHICEWGRV